MENEEPKKPHGGAVTHRCSQLIAHQRVAEVRSLMMAGMSSGTICKDLAVKWKVTERQVQNYITKVLHEITEAARLYGTEQRAAQRRMQLENLYETCVIAKEYKTAAVIMDRLCKIDGAYAPEQVRHDVAHRIATLTPEQKEERLRFLLSEREKYIDADYEENTTEENSGDM